jgi:hypothetical protein
MFCEHITFLGAPSGDCSCLYHSRPSDLLAHLLGAEVIEIHRVTGWYEKCSKWDSFTAQYYWTIFG